MDAISEMTSGLSDAHPSELDLSDFIPTDLLPTNGDLIVVALMNHDRAHVGADLTTTKSPASTALAAPAAASPSLVDRFERLRPAHQIILAAVAAAVVVASIGWVIGCLGTKAAVSAAAAAI